MKYVESINKALDFLISDQNAIVIGEDICDPYGGAFKVTKGLSTKYPDHVLQMPISEAAFVGFGIGMALHGRIVIIEIMFGDFSTLIMDQIVNGASKLVDLYGYSINLNIRLPMGGYRGYGATHSQSIEKMFIGIPGVTIYCPHIFSDPFELYNKNLNKSEIGLFIEHKMLYPINIVDNMYKDQYPLLISDLEYFTSVRIIEDESLITVVTYGGVAAMALDALIENFILYEVNFTLILLKKIYPLDERIISAIKSKKVLFVEEGSIDGGFGQYYANYINKKDCDYISKVIGSKNTSIYNAESLEKKVLINQENILDALKELMHI